MVELFAGVGGFRLGLEKASQEYKVVWSNQWEPLTRKQYASEIYTKRFGPENHSNKNLCEVITNEIPDHDLLVGGFPCQDYSVARTLNQSPGLEGKKGVLWWEIHRILKEKKNKPKYLLFENVDRLLKSPAKQRGRDFAVMLASLSDLGYIVEWRVINAAEYGMPQRRKRVFLMGYHKSTHTYHTISKLKDPVDWIIRDGVLAKSFNVSANKNPPTSFELKGNLSDVSENFNKHGMASPFENSGLIFGRRVYTFRTIADYTGQFMTLGDVVLSEEVIPDEYYLEPDKLERWQYLKGAKKDERVHKASGQIYFYTEGSMAFPDALDRPSRTIITGEGGSSPSRFKHVIKGCDGRLRRLTPIELERLNMFPDNHTQGVPDVKRAFMMGNALVVGIVEKIGKSLLFEVGV